MPSIQPLPSNNYLFDETTELNPDIFNSIFTSISNRLAAQEALIVDYEAAIDNLTGVGLEVIAATIGPTLAAARSDLLALQADAATLADQVASIAAGIIPAANVTENSTRVFVTPAQKTEIGALRTDLSTANTSISANASAIAAITAASLLPFQAVSTATTAMPFKRYLVDSSAGAVNITLPASPTNGDELTACRVGANAVTLLRNGKTIAGAASDLVIDANKQEVTVRYYNGNWMVAGRQFA